MNFDFNGVKKIYDDISQLCLKASLDREEKECFRVYDNILQECNKLVAKAIDVEEKDDDNESEEIKELNKAIFRVYFTRNPKDEEYMRDGGKRCFLLDWRSGGNAYDDLKKFALKESNKNAPDYNKIAELFLIVKDILNKDLSLAQLEQEINEVLAPYL